MNLEEIQAFKEQVKSDITALLENFTAEDFEAVRALYDTLDYLEKAEQEYVSTDNS